jgi:hypothetical protein
MICPYVDRSCTKGCRAWNVKENSCDRMEIEWGTVIDIGRIAEAMDRDCTDDCEPVYECKCVCGNTIFVKQSDLESGKVTSCGHCS